MSPAPRKKKDEEAPTAAEVEAKASEEAGESVPKADDEPRGREDRGRRGRGGRGGGRSRRPRPRSRAKKPAAEKADEAARPTTRPTPRRSRRSRAEEAGAEEGRRGRRPSDEAARPRAQARPAARSASRARRRSLVRAQARYVRTSARKARLVCDHIRGKDVEQARAILSFTPRGAAKPWLKLLESAIANAEHNHELVGDELKIASIHADEGPTLKRYRPRAMGRATRIRKRTSHLTITLTPKE